MGLLIAYMVLLPLLQVHALPLPNFPSQSNILSEDDSSPIIGFDCNQTEPEILSISTLEVKKCPEISTLAPVTVSTYGQIVQLHDIDNVKVMTCQLTKSTHYFKCGRNWYNYNVYPPSIGVIQDVTPKNCLKVHDSGFYLWSYHKEPWGDLKPNKTYHFSANEVGWTDPAGYCEGGTVEIGSQSYKDVVVQSSYTFSLRESYAQVDYSTGRINIEGTVGCNYKEGSCNDALSGTHIWTPNPQRCPEDKYRLLYEGTLNITTSKDNPATLLSIKSPPFLFTTELGIHTFTCGLDIQLTEFPNIYYIPKKEGSYQISFPRTSQNDIRFLTYLNSKITFLYHNIMDNAHKMYLSSLHETCKIEREMLKNRIEIIRLNSQSGGLSSLLKPGMFAKVNGEIIHLIKCKPVSVQFRNTDKCFDSLPIMYEEKPQFLLPNTHIISPYASPIECSPISPLSYKIGGVWWSYTGSFQRIPDPEILAPTVDVSNKFQKIRSFGKGGMYSAEQVEAVQKLLVFPQLRDSITTEFVRGITKFSPSPVSFDMTTIMSESDWKTIARRNIENVWGYFSSVGNAISGLIGIYFLYKLIKSAINCLIDSHELYRLFGCSLYLLTAIWGRLAQYFINRGRNISSETQTSSNRSSSNEPSPTQPLLTSDTPVLDNPSENPSPSTSGNEKLNTTNKEGDEMIVKVNPYNFELMRYLGMVPSAPVAPGDRTQDTKV